MGLGGIKAVVPVVLTRNSKATSTGIHWQQRSQNHSNDDKKTIKANTKISLFGFSSKKSTCGQNKMCKSDLSLIKNQ